MMAKAIARRTSCRKAARRSLRLERKRNEREMSSVATEVTVSVSSGKKTVKKSVTTKSSKYRFGTLSRQYENRLADRYNRVIGVDEAGRGPLAGPVVAAACYVPLDVEIDGIYDSKKLNETQREKLYEQLTSHPKVEYGVHVATAQRIDEINILQASLEAMTKAADCLPTPADFVYVDGNRMPPTLKTDAKTVVQGDSKVFSIAAASIIAKVTRDRMMVEYDAQYPVYGFAQHKGYPTKAHMAAITTHGPCPIHRMTFAPLKNKANKS